MKITKSKAVIFSIAVAFVSVFFFAYAVQAFYPAPQYEDFCDWNRFGVDDGIERERILTAGECEGYDGKWMSYGGMAKGGFDKGAWCDLDYQCRVNYEDARKSYERNVFFANLGIGIVLFIVAFFLALEAVSSGLMGGAVMLIVYGSMRYWGELSDIWRTLMLGVALVVLIWLGYRKLRN